MTRPRRALPAGFVREVVPVAPWVFGLVSISFAVLPASVQHGVRDWPVFYAGLVTATTLLSGMFVQSPLRSWTAQAAGRFGISAGVVGLAGGALATWLVSPVGVLLAAALLGVGYGGCLVAGLRFIETHSPPAERGRTTGIFYVLCYLGFAFPLLLAALAARMGTTAAVLCAAGLAAVSLVLRWLPVRT